MQPGGLTDRSEYHQVEELVLAEARHLAEAKSASVTCVGLVATLYAAELDTPPREIWDQAGRSV